MAWDIVQRMMIDAPSTELSEQEGKPGDTVQKLTPENADRIAAYINKLGQAQMNQ